MRTDVPVPKNKEVNMPPKTTRHVTEIFGPASLDTVWVKFETDAPLVGVSRGNIINPGLWPNSQAPMKMLRVTNLVHRFWERDSIVTHQTMILTAEVAGDDDVLLERDASVVTAL
jgi:hypothetical protein